eukprot:303980-Chlamydomonas_euryale.AAC.2
MAASRPAVAVEWLATYMWIVPNSSLRRTREACIHGSKCLQCLRADAPGTNRYNDSASQQALAAVGRSRHAMIGCEVGGLQDDSTYARCRRQVRT